MALSKLRDGKYWFVKNVRPDWAIFDVGAGVGCFSVLFSRLAIQGHIYAFEPTATVELLRANLAHNGCGNVQVEQLAFRLQDRRDRGQHIPGLGA